jgi:hypothetical protein
VRAARGPPIPEPCTPGGGAALGALGELLERRTGRLRVLMAADTHAGALIRRTIGLFNRLFGHTRGNIGVALRAWIRHIARVEHRRLTIGRPKPPRLEPLEALAPLQQQLLVHLALHRACAADCLHAAAGLAGPAGSPCAMS